MCGQSFSDREDLLDTLQKLQPHDHLCLIYETREEQFNAVIPFIKVGLERNERCVYIADENTVESVLDAMRGEGINVRDALDSGALAVITKQDAYLKQGHFDPDWMINYLKNITNETLAQGYSAVRATGEMTWALGSEDGVDRLIEYEAKLNYFFPDYPLLAICQYNKNRFSPEIIRNIIYTHPYVIVGGTVARNYYFIPPDEFLKEETQSQEVERLLHNIVSREQAELKLKRANEELETAYRLLEQDIGDREQAYDTLQRERALFLGGPVVVFRWRAAEGWPVEYVSPNVFQFGYPADDFISGAVPYTKIVSEKDRERVAREVEEFSTAGVSSFEQEYRVVTYSGDERWLYDYTIIERDAKGALTHYIGYVFDVTDRVKTQEENRRVQQKILDSQKEMADVLETIGEGVVVVDSEGKITRVNRQANAIWGYSEKELLDASISLIVQPDAQDTQGRIFEDYWKASATGTRGEPIIIDGVRRDGARFPLELCVTETKPGKLYTIAARDITNRVWNERLIKEKINELEQMNRELEEFQFLASHDMQEPIRAILNYTALLKTDLAVDPPPKATEDLKFIGEAARRVKTLVDDVLSLSNAGRSTLQMNKVDLNTLLKGVIAGQSDRIKKAGAQVLVEDLPPALGDPEALWQVFANLLENALNFRGAKTPVIKVSCVHQNGMLEITFEDNGIGIDKRYLNQIFTPFKKIPAKTAHEGTGTGLTICRKLIHRHGGAIRVESEAGGGSKFIFTLKPWIDQERG
ncbi:MAG: MEDS domain-containing protein [Nitrospinae bacterium]|nr:MEDS domain-containing protein [Nitrospinota bacterium]